VYGVYVNLPNKPTEADLEAHRVGLVSLFGIEHSTSVRASSPQRLRYVFDITGRVEGDGSNVKVVLLPIGGLGPRRRGAAAAASPTVRVGTIAVHAS
jgi:hypothetical protein